MNGRHALWLAAFALAAFAPTTTGDARGQVTPPPQALIDDPELARSDYLEQCAGCHGVEGSTAPAQLPELRGRVGWFMCTPEARAYLLRLPNVAQSRIRDNAELANMMNFVIFVLGQGSAPAGTRPFTEAEVARERRLALTTAALTVERARQANAVIARCHAPASLRLLYPDGASAPAGANRRPG